MLPAGDRKSPPFTGTHTSPGTGTAAAHIWRITVRRILRSNDGGLKPSLPYPARPRISFPPGRGSGCARRLNPPKCFAHIIKDGFLWLTVYYGSLLLCLAALFFLLFLAFELDSNGFELDSNGFELDSNGFELDSNWSELD